jgi:hypothetical protein
LRTAEFIKNESEIKQNLEYSITSANRVDEFSTMQDIREASYHLYYAKGMMDIIKRSDLMTEAELTMIIAQIERTDEKLRDLMELKARSLRVWRR